MAEPFCYYCAMMLRMGMRINYTYTRPIIGATVGFVDSLTNIGVLEGILDLTDATAISFTSAAGRALNLKYETEVDGMQVCLSHVGTDRRLG